MQNRKLKKGEILGIEKYTYDKPTDMPCFSGGNLGNDRYSIYGVVVGIRILETNNVYDEYEIVTGHGDSNSKVVIQVRYVDTDFTLMNEIHEYDPHKVYGDAKQWEDEIKTREVQISNWKKLIASNHEYKRQEKFERILKK